VFEKLRLTIDSYVEELGCTLGDALLEPHRSYLPLVRPLLDGGSIKAMAHITGGGITDNLPRILPRGTAAVVDMSSWNVPAIFRWLQSSGAIAIEEMMRTFNMGVGLIIVASRSRAEQLIQELAARGGRDGRIIGEVIVGAGEPHVTYTHRT
jgi:phosphoribosylformylglycinamidine cyclo-ligase